MEPLGEEGYIKLARKRAELIDEINSLLEQYGNQSGAHAEHCLIRSYRAQVDCLTGAMDSYDRWLDRKGAWIPTATGGRVWLQDPRPGDFDIQDIAYTLARINRFSGAINQEHYSVAEHSVTVARLLPQRARLAALLHDASEAYLCDITTPVKDLIRPLYEPLERNMQDAILRQFGCKRAFDYWADDIHKTDRQVLTAEAKAFSAAGFITKDFGFSSGSVNLRQFGLPPGEAHRQFVSAFQEFREYGTDASQAV